MDIRELKQYIYDNNYVETLLISIGCHSIKFHPNNNYWSCANKTGDNKTAIIVYNNEWLTCVNFTRKMTQNNSKCDLITLVCYTLNTDFPQAVSFICNEIGISYYHDFRADMPSSFKVLEMLSSMNSNSEIKDDVPLLPIDENVLNYYKPYVNDLFFNDGISYLTQLEFEVGYDEYSNRITMPIRDELGNLIGVKGRIFKNSDNLTQEEIKYLYIEPCNKSKILYGLFKTLPYIKHSKRVYVLESEKAVMQLWSMGYCNAVATGGKTISQHQIDMLTRLGVDIVLCFDKDVEKQEIESIVGQFIENVPVYYMYDEDNILNEKESPSDSREKWEYLISNNIYNM